MALVICVIDATVFGFEGLRQGKVGGEWSRAELWTRLVEGFLF